MHSGDPQFDSAYKQNGEGDREHHSLPSPTHGVTLNEWSWTAAESVEVISANNCVRQVGIRSTDAAAPQA